MMIISLPSLCFFAPPPSSSRTLSFSLAKSKAQTLALKSSAARGAAAAKAAFSSSRASEISHNVMNASPTNASLACKQTTVREDNTRPPASSGDDDKRLQACIFLIAAYAAIILEVEKQRTKAPLRLAAAAAFDPGTFLDGHEIFRQSFLIRSYEAQPNGRVSLETLMNYLQEVVISQLKVAGILGGNYGATREMNRRNLLWVFIRAHVEVEHYPSWGEIVEVKAWMSSIGKNSVRRNWHFKNVQTGQTVMKATCITMLMHKHTRKFCKFPDEVNEEVKHLFSDQPAIFSLESKASTKFDEKKADCVKSGLTPRWSDIDANMHVNNVKCIGFLLESTPVSILESHQLSSMALEFRRECRVNSVLRSLTAVSGNCNHGSSESGSIECKHLLQLESGAVLVKGLTGWRPKDHLRDRDPIPIPDSSI